MSAEWWVAIVQLVECADTQFAHFCLVACQQAADKVLARVLIYFQICDGVCGYGPGPYGTVVEVSVAFQLTTYVFRTIVPALWRDSAQAFGGV